MDLDGRFAEMDGPAAVLFGARDAQKVPIESETLVEILRRQDDMVDALKLHECLISPRILNNPYSSIEMRHLNLNRTDLRIC